MATSSEGIRFSVLSPDVRTLVGRLPAGGGAELARQLQLAGRGKDPVRGHGHARGPSIAGLLLTGLIEDVRVIATCSCALASGVWAFAGMPSRSCPRPSSRPASCSRFDNISAPHRRQRQSCSAVWGQPDDHPRGDWLDRLVVPRLRRRHGVPMTGLIVGVLWGLWHFLQQVFVSVRMPAGPVARFLMLSLSPRSRACPRPRSRWSGCTTVPEACS